jgi:peroxiredoxin
MGLRTAAAVLLAPFLLLAADENPPTLAIAAQAPDFSLPGTDGKTHRLADFSNGKALAIIFTAVHCPTAEGYEERMKKLVADYEPKGVRFVAIQPNSPKALRLDEMGYTDLGDTLEDMKLRAEHRKFNFPYLYDGDEQQVSRAYGPTATPHVFIFDAQRKLRYHGRIDSSPREEYAKVPDARNALDAVLAGRTVAVAQTPSVGCSIKWASKQTTVDAESKRIAAEPVKLEPAGAEELRKLRRNPTGKTLLVNFWTTWCGPCIAEFPEFQKMWRMYRNRPFELVMVSANFPDEEKGVRKVLDANHATTRNLIFSGTDTYEQMAAFDPEWNGAVPYTMLIAPDGKVLYRIQGPIEPLKLRRMILASFPDDDYVGQNAYWNAK